MLALCHLAGIYKHIWPHGPDGVAVSGVEVCSAFGTFGGTHVCLERHVAVIQVHFRTIERINGHVVEFGGDDVQRLCDGIHQCRVHPGVLQHAVLVVGIASDSPGVTVHNRQNHGEASSDLASGDGVDVAVRYFVASGIDGQRGFEFPTRFEEIARYGEGLRGALVLAGFEGIGAQKPFGVRTDNFRSAEERVDLVLYFGTIQSMSSDCHQSREFPMVAQAKHITYPEQQLHRHGKSLDTKKEHE